MEITEVRIRHQNEDGKLKALVSVTFDGVFAVHDIKIIEGSNRLFLAMPSRKMSDGRFRDIVHPIGEEMRQKMENEVLKTYALAVREEKQKAEDAKDPLGEDIPSEENM